MPNHVIQVSDHELAVLNYIISTYETVLKNVKYSKWKREEAMQDLASIKVTVGNARQTLKFYEKV